MAEAALSQPHRARLRFVSRTLVQLGVATALLTLLSLGYHFATSPNPLAPVAGQPVSVPFVTTVLIPDVAIALGALGVAFAGVGIRACDEALEALMQAEETLTDVSDTHRAEGRALADARAALAEVRSLRESLLARLQAVEDDMRTARRDLGAR